MSLSLDKIVQLLSRMFILALYLYPGRMRREYAEEMQAVFRLKAMDAARRGPLALFVMTLREARDLPLAATSAHLRVPGSFMNRYFPATDDQVSWTAALLSLIPLFLAGPGRIIVFYESGFIKPQVAWYFFPYLVACILVALCGLGLGALRNYPRWSYPYAFTLIFALTDLYNTATYRYGMKTIGQNSFFVFLPLVLVALYLPPLRLFYRNIRRDWTLLSYSLFGVVLFILSQFDTDEYPVLGLGVLLPSLIALCAALAHLRIRQAPVRIMAMEAGALVGLFFWLIGIFTGGIYIIIGIILGLFLLLLYGLILTVIVLSPLLVMMIRHSTSKGDGASRDAGTN